jgi:hypothetical protein
MAAATLAAPAAAHVFFRRHPTQLQGFVDVLLNGRLNVMQLLLGVEEVAGDGIVEDSFALFFEIVNFFATERRRHLLLLLKRLAFGDEIFVLRARLFVSHECINPLANGLHSGLVQDCLAQFPGFLENGSFFNRCLHNL